MRASFYFIILVFIFPLIVLLALTNFAYPQEVYIEEALNKDSFVEGEPIYLYLSIKNNGPNSANFSQHEDIFLFNEMNEPVSNGIHPSAIPEVIKPGEKLTKLINITDRFGNGSRGGYWYLRKGTYRIDIKLSGNMASERKAFKVLGRSQKEEKVFQEFLTVRELPSDYDGSQKEQLLISKAELYKNLTSTPTNTVFDPLFVYSHLRFLSLTGAGSSSSFFNLCDRFIKNHIDDGKNRIVLLTMVRHFQAANNKQGAVEYFNNLKQQDLPSDLQQFIENKILPQIDKI